MHFCRVFVVLIPLFSEILGEAGRLTSHIGLNGEYAFTSGDNSAFSITNGTTFLQSNGKLYSSSDDSIILQSRKSVSGSDINGHYVGMVFSYSAGGAAMENQVLVYDGGRFVRFTQSFPKGVTKSNVSDTNSVLSSFPSFSTKGEGLKEAGYLQLKGDMCGHEFHIDNFNSGVNKLMSGQEVGPIVIFDIKGNAMVISSFSNFMAHNAVYQKDELRFGIMGGFTNIPTHYQIDTILYYGSNGINQVIEGWGEVITRRYGKTRVNVESDLTVKYIGYWTDNGAFYYYNTEKDKNYEQTMLDVAKDFQQKFIPYRYLQYDSWWYYKGDHGGVTEWVSMPEVFPNGSVGLFEELGMPVGAHNRYWSSKNVYAIDNGGKYQFLFDKKNNKAVPIDDYFWSDLMHNATKWGLRMYEQDWENVEFEGVEEFHNDISLGKQWLMQMGNAAQLHGQTIQYCMALSRHMMQSVEIPAVTQARVSDDYQPGNDQWKIGITSMFAHSLNIAPFKDTFWTTTDQPGSPYHLKREPFPTLQAAIATLSTGPVGPSDSIGHSSAEILKQIYRQDGLILKPSRAITMVDEQILNRAFPDMTEQFSANLEAEIYSTYTDLHYSGEPLRHGYILATDITTSEYKVYPKAMHIDLAGRVKTYLAYRGHPAGYAGIVEFNSTSPLHIPKCGRSDFQLWYAAPVTDVNGTRVAILGERTKFVPISSQRIVNVEHKMDNLLIDIAGSANEIVPFDVAVNGTVSTIYCSLSINGQARISMNHKACFLP